MKILTTAVLLISLAVPAHCSFFGTETTLKSSVTTQKICVQHPLKDGFGLFAFATQNKFYGQSYFGLTYFKPGDINIEVAAGYGTETTPEPGRFGGWIWTGKDKLSMIYAYEDSKNGGVWDKLELKYQIDPKIAIGFVHQDFIGDGPVAEIKIGGGLSAKYYATSESHVLQILQSF